MHLTCQCKTNSLLIHRSKKQTTILKMAQYVSTYHPCLQMSTPHSPDPTAPKLQLCGQVPLDLGVVGSWLFSLSRSDNLVYKCHPAARQKKCIACAHEVQFIKCCHTTTLSLTLLLDNSPKTQIYCWHMNIFFGPANRALASILLLSINSTYFKQTSVYLWV